MSAQKSDGSSEPKIFDTLFNDVRKGDLRRTVRRDFKDLKAFYINDERKKRLEKMGRIKRWFFISVWLFKSLFFKLTPARRFLFIIAFIFLFSFNTGNSQTSFNGLYLSGLIFMFILMLELKDKLLAKDELETGRSVQYALMPERSISIPGWELYLFSRPANEVGGDLIDFIPLKENRYGVVLGDVSGKGLGAALFMVRLQAVIRAIAPDYESLAKLGKKINEIFYRDRMNNKFASVVYTEIQPGSNKLSFLNAGHMPPVILKDGQIEELTKGQPALGIMPDIDYNETIIELQNGHSLLIYSDGVTEARNMDGDFYTEQRLFKMLHSLTGLSAKETGEKLTSEIDRFVGDAPANDDLSLIIIKRTE
ncbi:MAG: PP2C family protein-serine/threonine phosphatase [Calditrichaceae bacterium]